MASRKQHRPVEDDDDIFDHHHHDKHHNRHQQKPKLPVIPDLRFEYSYLRSVRPYVHVERVQDSAQQHLCQSSAEELLDDYEKLEMSEEAEQGDADGQQPPAVQNPSTGPKEVVRVEWKKVIWVTTRDQVISPLLQGALWAISSYFLTPYSASLGSKVRHLMHAKPPTKEGNAAGWLRKWVKSLGLTTKSAEESRRLN